MITPHIKYVLSKDEDSRTPEEQAMLEEFLSKGEENMVDDPVIDQIPIKWIKMLDRTRTPEEDRELYNFLNENGFLGESKQEERKVETRVEASEEESFSDVYEYLEDAATASKLHKTVVDIAVDRLKKGEFFLTSEMFFTSPTLQEVIKSLDPDCQYKDINDTKLKASFVKLETSKKDAVYEQIMSATFKTTLKVLKDMVERGEFAPRLGTFKDDPTLDQAIESIYLEYQ